MPGNGSVAGTGQSNSFSPARGAVPPTGEDGWNGEQNDTATGHVGLDQTFKGVSSKHASINEQSKGASSTLLMQTIAATAASSEGASLGQESSRPTASETTTAHAASSSIEHRTNTNTQTTTLAGQNKIPSSNMASLATEVTLGQEDKSPKKRVPLPTTGEHNSKKRAFLPIIEPDEDITFGQNAMKKPKLSHDGFKLKKATVPELGSDEPSPTPPPSKKTKGRIRKATAPKMKLEDDSGEGQYSEAKKPAGLMQGGLGAMLPPGGGHQRGRHMFELQAAPSGGDSDVYEEEDGTLNYPQNSFHDNSRHYGLEAYGMASSIDYHSHRYPYGGLPSRGLYENAYSGHQPHYRINPPFMPPPNDHYGPNIYQPSHVMGPGSHSMPPLNPNATSFDLSYHSNPVATASRMSSARLPNPSITVVRPASRHVSRPTSVHQTNPSEIPYHQIDAPAPTSVPSSLSNRPTTADPVNPNEDEGGSLRQGKIYLADGIETIVKICPCCRRGF